MRCKESVINPLVSDRQLTIGVLAKRTGFNVSALRYYEEVGLLPPATRRPSGHRVFDEKAQEVLTLIRHCRDFGFSIDETRALVSLSTSDESDCVQARDIAQLHLETVRAKLGTLQNLERSLAGFVQACSDSCVGGPAPKCCILTDLNVRDAQPAKQTGCC